MWRSEDVMWQLVLSFCHMGPNDGTQVIRLTIKHCYLPEPSVSANLDFSKRPRILHLKGATRNHIIHFLCLRQSYAQLE